jgi:hypothetical protein
MFCVTAQQLAKILSVSFFVMAAEDLTKNLKNHGALCTKFWQLRIRNP